MAVFRIEKTKDYTVMSNHHLRNTSLSLKAKGLLSLMLSLPEEWDYTTKGLACICKDGVDSISAGIRELEAQGYLRRERIRNANGQLGSIEYTILEQPVPPEPVQESPILASPERDNPEQEEPVLEERPQLNIYKSNKEKSNTDLSNIDSIPSPSSPSPAKHREHSHEAKRKEAILSEMEEYRDLVKQNIDYPGLIRDMPYECDQIDEIVEIMVETLCSTKDMIRVAGNDFPADVVRSRLLKLNSDHIGFVIGCMKENTTKIRNIKQYLLTTLYNAPITIDSYYSALVNHDLAKEQEKPKRNGIPEYTWDPSTSL